jgi:hypothetical protein
VTTYADIVKADSPYAYWRLGEASGTTAVDEMAAAHNGSYLTFNADTGLNTPGAVILGVPGALGCDASTAFSPTTDGDNNGSFATITNLSTLGSSLAFGLSIETWIKLPTDKTQDVPYVIELGNYTSLVSPYYTVGRVDLYMIADDPEDGATNIYFSVDDNVGKRWATNAEGPNGEIPPELFDNAWHHLVVTWDGDPDGVGAIYLDGKALPSVCGRVGSQSTGAFTFVNWTNPGCIAGLIQTRADNTPIPFFTGTLEEVAIYNKALTAGQVAAHYAARNIACMPTHATVGDVETVSVIPGPEEDEVWTIVKRVINGATVRHIEVMTPRSAPVYLDSSKTQTGSASNTMNGLGHLENTYVDVLADGVVYHDLVVTSGVVTLPGPATAKVISAGLPSTYVLEPMRQDLHTRAGQSHGSLKRQAEVVLSLLDSRGVTYGSTLTTLYTIPETSTTFTGDVPLHFDGGFDITDALYIVGSDPLPCDVRAIVLRMDVTGR